MSTKLTIATVIAALSLATAAFAAEGGGDPFPFRVPGQTVYVTMAPDTGSAQYPASNPALSVPSLTQATLPQNGQEGPVETANSLPARAMEGTVAYAQAQSVSQWLAQQAQHRFALRQAHPAG